MFWRARRLWPGDPLFSPDRFGELPVRWLYEAVRRGTELRRKELHELELPIANLSTMTANMNRDSKKQRTPYKLTDFCFFATELDKNSPDNEPAAAYMKLLDQGKLPNWALFVYPDMKATGKEGTPPAILAAMGEDVILLAPVPKNGGMEGLLLARSSVSGKDVEVTVNGYKTTISLPKFEGSVIAREHFYAPAF